MYRLMISPAVWCVVLLGCCFSCVSAEDETCYTSGSVAGIVIATVVVTLVMTGLAVAFIWYLWRHKRGDFGDDKCQEKPIACPPMSPDKQLIVRENNDYAFDNPYFKDDETDHAKHDAAEKGESGFHLDNGDITPSQNAKASNGTNGQHKKNRPFSSLPFHAVFHPSGKKQRATVDDTYLSKHLERISVPLRGHDFTGLGFNICGNMRDGIFVKDVLHRGPASESGKIKAGDRIVSLTVSFGGMVYEDALTILSYASPYDVKLEIEKIPLANSVANAPNLPSSSPKRLGASTSFRNCGKRTLLHPLYRSQSIDDLTQIGKDSLLSGNSPAANTKNQKDTSTSSATPKRSQSVEASNGGPKARSAFSIKSGDESKSLSSNKGSRKSSTSSCDSTLKITAAVPMPEKTQPAPEKEEAPCSKKEVKSSRFRVEQISVKSEAPILPTRQAPPVKPARDTADEKQVQDSVTPAVESVQSSEKLSDVPQPPTEEPDDVTIIVQAEASQGVAAEVFEADAVEKQPMAPPRKSNGTPAKRRAPAPPPGPTKTETSAVVHRADEQPAEKSEPSTDPPPPPTSEVPDSAEPDPGSSDTSSLASGPDPKEEPSSPGKRKASSLGDLTKLEQGSGKKTSASSAILERAVSMDLQQSLPGENLTKQKKILRAPTFEDDYDENREGDLNDTEGAGLKRWDDGLDKVLAGLTNGHIKLDDDVLKDEDIAIAMMTDHATNQSNEPVGESQAKKVLTVDLVVDLDSSGSETTLQDNKDSEKQLTSTPNRKLIEVKDFIKDDDVSLDDVPYLASAQEEGDEESSTKHSIRSSSSSITGPLFSPVTISIPIIKPDLTHYEKLPSPPPASTHPSLDPSWRASKISTSDETGRYPLERISVQSLYRPIFTKDSNENDETIPDTVTEKLVNGNESDSSEHYSTAQENTTTSSIETSTLSVTLSSSVANNVIVKTPNNAAGFAKTLIIPGPSEVENLLSLAAEPNTPPPQLEPPPKPIENQ